MSAKPVVSWSAHNFRTSPGIRSSLSAFLEFTLVMQAVLNLLAVYNLKIQALLLNTHPEFNILFFPTRINIPGFSKLDILMIRKAVLDASSESSTGTWPWLGINKVTHLAQRDVEAVIQSPFVTSQSHKHTTLGFSRMWNKELAHRNLFPSFYYTVNGLHAHAVYSQQSTMHPSKNVLFMPDY